MQTQNIIQQKVLAALQPLELQVINESDQHNVPANSETHFKLLIVSEQFDGMTLVNRHRTVNRLLVEELQGGVHALSLQTHTAKEWESKGGLIPDSPSCLGGDGRAAKL